MQGEVTLSSWHCAWRALGAADGSEPLFRQLIARYSEPHRHYHTLQHLRECLGQFEAVRQDAQRAAEICIALWFHDIVYDVHRQDNEQRSADWAHQAVLDAGQSGAVAGRVHALVMATRHLAMPLEHDAQLLVDSDLAILGADEQRFDESDAQIRAEYAHVAQAAFCIGRREILGGFLARPRIYSTEHFHAAYEARARENLNRSLARLATQ